MGLDMYLDAEVYLSGGYEHVRKAATGDSPSAGAVREVLQFDTILSVLGLGDARSRFEEMNSLSVSVRVGYWRKANAIHAWFVKNLQDGKDECQRTYVPRSSLEELLVTCQKILATVEKGEPVTQHDEFWNKDYETFPNLKFDTALAEELLPSQSGFFFGSTAYDQWYVHDLELTVRQIEALLAHPILGNGDLYYRSSW